MMIRVLTAFALLLSLVTLASSSLPAQSRVRLLFDLGHHNLIAENPARVESVAGFLSEQGYAVEKSVGKLTPTVLADARLLMIVNARAERNVKEWALPAPSAFEPDEATAVRAWVERGGGLLLVVDHMPFPGGAGELAAAFGIEFTNGFVVDEAKLSPEGKLAPLGGLTSFSRSAGTLNGHPITNGKTAAERVDSISFDTGSLFRAPAGASPLLTIPSGYVALIPERAWQFRPDTPRVSAAGGLQGAALRIGRGRVAVFADAGAVMTPELAQREKDPAEAQQKVQIFVNTLRWLVGSLG